ncbi:MAG: glycine--tRNA ligase subunit beta, partial [Betaproteobacteria bacterium]|nr:glycine--tRNA ligase subunit beta [Betaproteobacteria bacterium]
MMTQNANLLVEIFVEELPPKALNQLGEAFATVLHQHLKTMGLASATSQLQVFASPRRLAAHISDVAKRANDVQIEQKLMPVSVGLDQSGLATPALQKKLQALSLDVSVVSQLKQKMDGKSLTLFVDSMVKGVELQMGLQKALEESLSKLPIPKLMTYQLEKDCELPGWSSVHFVRPVHGLLALHGSDVVAVHALGLQASNTTQGHRFEALKPVIVIEHADVYAQVMAKEGAVIASFAKRREEIRTQLEMAAKQIGGVKPIDDEALLNEVTALVERPKVMVCGFEKEFLSVPQECLILTMKANQKYFPLLDESGRLTHQFLVVSNINPSDPSAVISGNQRVVRPRLADAQFFFDQDRKKTLASRVDGLKQVVYHNKLGTQGDRMLRVKALATKIAMMLGEDAMVASVESAAQLAKTDLLTDMVGEFPELQGVMGGYYARHDGLSDSVAWAIEDHYKPRFAGDELPRQTVGLVVALADKLETLIGMFGIGSLPSGEKDPFALRRHALGVIRMLVEKNLNLPL